MLILSGLFFAVAIALIIYGATWSPKRDDFPSDRLSLTIIILAVLYFVIHIIFVGE